MYICVYIYTHDNDNDNNNNNNNDNDSNNDNHNDAAIDYSGAGDFFWILSILGYYVVKEETLQLKFHVIT